VGMYYLGYQGTNNTKKEEAKIVDLTRFSPDNSQFLANLFHETITKKGVKK
jgi:hypothetical protein